MKSAPNRSGTLRKAASIGLVTVVSMAAAGCLRVSNGTWYIKSAATPEGWPALTPVGSVEVKDYPVYRAATEAFYRRIAELSQQQAEESE